MFDASSRRGLSLAGLLVAAPLVLAGCGGSSSGGAANATSSEPATTATTPTAASSSGTTTSDSGATFDGAFNGTLTLNLCTNGDIGSVKATVDGDEATDYLGSVSATELNFKGPQGGIYSTKSGTTIKVTSGSFDVDGLVLTDDLITHKSVTVHGTLTCP